MLLGYTPSTLQCQRLCTLYIMEFEERNLVWKTTNEEAFWTCLSILEIFPYNITYHCTEGSWFCLCKGGRHTGLWNIGMWHFSQMDPKLSILIPKVIIVAPKTFQRFIFVFERFSLKNLRDFLWNALTLSIFELEKRFFFKQVRISPEIDWYHYQSANAAPTGIVWHQKKTDLFWRSFTSEPTV